MPLNNAIELLYTPQDYECKLLFQTWQHLIRADSRKIMESCDDPPPLSNNPITLTRLIVPGSQPPISPRYYTGCPVMVATHGDLVTAPCNPFNHRTGVYGAMVGGRLGSIFNSGIVKIRSCTMTYPLDLRTIIRSYKDRSLRYLLHIFSQSHF